eukprot:gene45267-9805_t
MPTLLEERDEIVALKTFKTHPEEGEQEVTVKFGELGKVDRIDDDGDAFVKWIHAVVGFVEKFVGSHYGFLKTTD